MRRTMVTLSQEDVALFSSGSNLKSEHVTPLIGTNCIIMLCRCRDESQNAIAQMEDLVGPLHVDKETEVVLPP